METVTISVVLELVVDINDLDIADSGYNRIEGAEKLAMLKDWERGNGDPLVYLSVPQMLEDAVSIGARDAVVFID